MLLKASLGLTKLTLVGSGSALSTLLHSTCNGLASAVDASIFFKACLAVLILLVLSIEYNDGSQVAEL